MRFFYQNLTSVWGKGLAYWFLASVLNKASQGVEYIHYRIKETGRKGSKNFHGVPGPFKASHLHYACQPTSLGPELLFPLSDPYCRDPTGPQLFRAGPSIGNYSSWSPSPQINPNTADIHGPLSFLTKYLLGSPSSRPSWLFTLPQIQSPYFCLPVQRVHNPPSLIHTHTPPLPT